MKRPTIFKTSCLAVLLLTGYGLAIAEPASQEPAAAAVEAQASSVAAEAAAAETQAPAVAADAALPQQTATTADEAVAAEPASSATDTGTAVEPGTEPEPAAAVIESAPADVDASVPEIEAADKQVAPVSELKPPLAAPEEAEAGPAVADSPHSGDALTPDVPAADTPAAEFSAESLYGQWIVKEQHPEAGEVVTLFSINSDASFAGTLTVAGEVVWTYSGAWSLDGNLITWIYTESTPPLMQVNEAEIDEILSIDDEKLTYRSGTRDVVETLYRVVD